MHVREKDQQLAELCQRSSKAVANALDWLEDNRSLVGAQFSAVHRELKTCAVEARVLSRAAERPMSVAIFGPSQHGKTFLIGKMLQGDFNGSDAVRQRQQAGKVIFGRGEQAVTLDFLSEVSPQGGNETTGLVTRFSLSVPETPPGYPVRLRLLREIDIVKILANSFIFDMDGDGVTVLDEARVAAVLDSAQAQVTSTRVDAMETAHLYELEDYFLQAFKQSHPMKGSICDAFWTRAGRLAPYLPAAARAALFSLLWGEIPQFTAIYLELKQALDKLGHAEYAYASLDMIRDRLPGKSILHVLTMKQGLGDLKGSSELGQIAMQDGTPVVLRKPTVTALTSELHVTLASRPWQFFEHTDLLDFPGARSRVRRSRQAVLEDSAEAYPLGEAFLRGKVAVLFDSYSADIDVNTLIACHKPEQVTVTKFSELIEEWVARTHGGTPAAREGRPVNLFYCVTFADTLLAKAAGDRADVAMENKLSGPLRNFSNCINEWTPGQPFNNTFITRNPNARLDAFFTYLDAADKMSWVETGMRAEQGERLREMEAAFGTAPLVHRHIDNAAEKWHAMLTLNDGGVTYLARCLEPACDPDVKYEQVSVRVHVMRRDVLRTLENFFESEDIEARIGERMARIGEVIEILRRQLHLVPRLITELQVQQERLRQLYLDFARQRLVGRGGPASASAQSIGETVVGAWIASLDRRARQEERCRPYQLSSEQFRCLTGELEAGARRLKLSTIVDERVATIEDFGQKAERRADHVATDLYMLLGDFTNYLARGGMARLEPQVDSALFTPGKLIDSKGMPVLAEKRMDMKEPRERFMRDWLVALEQFTRTNAGSSEGTLVDIEQNRRLGQVLHAVRGAG